ncbi:gas vesicle protein [Streptomyces sp. NPDC052036]|uniref:gas vesicle protein GvpO n=1 Tax=unclassified Streptomyces TaxID=2593676 RepID=UPI00342B6D38
MITNDPERKKASSASRKPSSPERKTSGGKREQSSQEPEASGPGRVPAPQAMKNAAQQLSELLGRAPQSVSALKPTADGWEALVEVVELERIPDTSSVMASYKVVLDPAGQLMAYERARRYTRAQVDREGR